MKSIGSSGVCDENGADVCRRADGGVVDGVAGKDADEAVPEEFRRWDARCRRRFDGSHELRVRRVRSGSEGSDAERGDGESGPETVAERVCLDFTGMLRVFVGVSSAPVSVR